MRFLAIAAAKISSSAIKLSGAGMGSSLPGKIAGALDPALLSHLTNQLSQGCIAVTGTNGKSTTSGLLASILQTAGYKVIHNRQGANLIAGITATLVESAALNGSLQAELGIFEVDEAALPVLTKQVFYKTVIVTNLFATNWIVTANWTKQQVSSARVLKQTIQPPFLMPTMPTYAIFLARQPKSIMVSMILIFLLKKILFVKSLTALNADMKLHMKISNLPPKDGIVLTVIIADRILIFMAAPLNYCRLYQTSPSIISKKG